jgi:hypothetical protein
MRTGVVQLMVKKVPPLICKSEHVVTIKLYIRKARMRIYSRKFGRFRKCRTRNKKCILSSFAELYFPVAQEVWPGSLVENRRSSGKLRLI